MAGFVAQLPVINQIADESPGFVWRLQGELGDSTTIRAFDDPRILVNFSIWESPDALRQFVYRSGHVQPLRQRAEWFEPPREAHLALWWMPSGHIPTVEDALDRLVYRRQHGDTAVAFSLAELFPAPIEPEAEPADPGVSLDERVFIWRENTPNGDASPETNGDRSKGRSVVEEVRRVVG